MRPSPLLWCSLLAACGTQESLPTLALDASGPPVTISVSDALPGQPLLVTLEGVPDGASLEAGVAAFRTSQCRIQLEGLCSQLRQPAVTGTGTVIAGTGTVAMFLPAQVPAGATLYVQVAGSVGQNRQISSVIEVTALGDTTPPDAPDCAVVQTVVDANCTSCHGAAQLGNMDIRNIADVVGVASDQLPSMNLIEPGDRDASYLMHKLEGTHTAISGPGLAMPPAGPLDAADIEAIGDWIDAGATCASTPVDPPTPATYDPNTLDQASLFVCDGSPSSSQARLRRHDRESWRRTIGQRPGSAAANNPLDAPGSLAFSTYADQVSFDPATLDLYMDVVAFAGGAWTDRFPDSYGWSRQYGPVNDSRVRCMFNDAAPDTACIDTYLDTFFAGGAGYRPLTTDELTRLRTFTESALADEATSGGDRILTLSHVTSAAWMMTGVLFQSEMGEGAPDAFGRTRLGNWEVAHMLGRMISDRTPGAQGVFRWGDGPADHGNWSEGDGGHMPDIVAAAADGSIQQDATLRALFSQYAAGIDPNRFDEMVDIGTTDREARAHEWMGDKLDRFFLEWFDVEAFPTEFKESVEATSEYDGGGDEYSIGASYRNLQSGYYGREPTMLEMFNDTISRIVVEDSDVLAELLTTRQWYLASSNASLGSSIDTSTRNTHRPFNLDTHVNATTAERWVTLPATERAGMLTHPAWLSSHGDAFEDGPSMVARGKWIRENLLCETVPPLELVTVEAQLLASDGTKTARERVDESIEPRSECMACHQYMNALGRPFEIYNHAGFLRADDHGNAPDGSSVLDNAPDPVLNRSYTDAVDLMESLAGSEHVKRCFVRQTFRFFAGRDELPEDACALSAMEEAYDTNGGSFLSMVEALAAHETILYRHVSEEVSP